MSRPFSGYIRGVLCIFLGLFFLSSPLIHRSAHAIGAAIALVDQTVFEGQPAHFLSRKLVDIEGSI